MIPKIDSVSHSNERLVLKAVAAAATLVLIGLSTSACRDEEHARVAGWSMIDPAQRHAIRVSREPEQMSLRVSRSSRGLSPQQRAQVVDFAARARAADAGNTKIVIASPAGSPNEVSSARAVDQIRYLLGQSGIADSSIGLEAYHANGEVRPPVRMAFVRYVAHAPECGYWPSNLARETHNIPYENFGCATQRNFANQVANPGDLVEPRSETERSGERRDKAWENYTQGKPTGAERSKDERSDVNEN